MVCIGLEATFNAKELALAPSVFFGAMTTSQARPRRVARVNDNQRDTRRFALVSDERPKLREGPRKPFVALSLSHRNPLSNALKVFERDCPLLNECFVDDMTTNVVVHPSLVTRLFLADALQVPLGRFGAAGLKPLPKPLKTAAALLDACARVRLAVAVYRQLNYSEVNTENVLRVNRRGRRQLHRDVQVERAVPQNEVGLPSGTVKPRRLVRTVAHGDKFAPFQAHERNLRQALEGHDARVVDHRPVQVKPDVYPPVSLVGFYGLRNGAYRHLAGQAKLGAQGSVDERLERNLVGEPLLVGDIGDVLTATIERLHSFQQCLVLLLCRFQLDDDNLFHSKVIIP